MIIWNPAQTFPPTLASIISKESPAPKADEHKSVMDMITMFLRVTDILITYLLSLHPVLPETIPDFEVTIQRKDVLTAPSQGKGIV
jgi:hypothetical protein